MAKHSSWIRNLLVLILIVFAPLAWASDPDPRFPVVDAGYYVVLKMVVAPEKIEWFVEFWKNRMMPVFE